MFASNGLLHPTALKETNKLTIGGCGKYRASDSFSFLEKKKKVSKFPGLFSQLSLSDTPAEEPMNGWSVVPPQKAP